jgi:lipoprotein-anchoring transpeptidase ErfK/SrfK
MVQIRIPVLPLIIIALAASPALGAKQSSRSVALTPESINEAQWSPRESPGRLKPVVLKAQVLLDRAGFSPGVIDAHDGANFAKALRAYQEAKGLESTGKLDEPTWFKLAETFEGAAVRTYIIAAADIEGPFIKRISMDFRKASKLHRLAYRSPRELLAEKFHTSEDLLSALNSEKRFDRADIQIIVPNVNPLEASSLGREAHREQTGTVGFGGSASSREVGRVEVDKPRRAVRAFDLQGRLIAFYPASIGSDDKPAPSGAFEVRSVARNPTYRYNPKYAFKGQKTNKPVEISPGPNNPVGLVWIALSAPSYGIHGTPDPDKVSKTESHGCIRLTNWDALALAKVVRKGTRVQFLD